MKLVLMALVTTMLVSCGGAEEPSTEQHGDVAMELTAASAPHRGTNTFTLKTATDATKVEIYPWMPSMGHGSPEDPTIVKEQDGSYRLENVVFSMPGAWELKVNVTCPNRHGMRAFRYEVP